DRVRRRIGLDDGVRVPAHADRSGDQSGGAAVRRQRRRLRARGFWIRLAVRHPGRKTAAPGSQTNSGGEALRKFEVRSSNWRGVVYSRPGMLLARRRALNRGVAALPLIVALGAGLRLFQLTRESVWMEEAFSLELAKGTLGYMVDRTAHDAHPPLYY